MQLKGSLLQSGATIVLNNGATTQCTLTSSNAAAATITLPGVTATLVGRATTDTLTNKTLSGNTAVTLISGSGTLTLNTSGTVTLPNATDTLVGKATTDTLTNKTLSGNTAVTLISGSGTLTLNTSGTVTLPNATDTMVGKATTDTLTNKTLSGNTAVTLISGSGTLTLNTTGTITLPNATDTLVGKATTDTLTNKTLTSPTMTTPTLGAATATTINKVTITQPATSATLTLSDGSSLINSGGFSTTLTATGITNVTLPVSGTLSTIAGVETLTNKTLTSPGLNESVAVTTTATKLNYLTSAGGTTGTASTNIVFSTSPTLVTPVLGAATATTINKVTITQPASGSTLTIVDGGSLITAGAFAITLTATGATGVTLPTTGTLSTLAGAEVITNKDHDGGTASNTSRLTVPKAALSTLTGLTRKQGTIVYDTTANALLADDGSNLNSIGGGSGEKNYITAPSTASGWTSSDVNGVTVATDVTSSIPRPNTSKSGLLITGVTGTTAYIYYRFILDDADANTKMKFQFSMRPGTAVASDFEVRVYSNTANDYTTGNTRLALSTDNSTPASLLPALTGTYRTTFDSPAISAKYIEVRIKMAASQAHTLYISDVIVGPGVVTQGAAVSEWTAYTPTVANFTGTPVGKWRRVGDSMQVRVYDASTTTVGGLITVAIPTGFTIDTTKLAFSNGLYGLVGTAQAIDLGNGFYYGSVAYNSSTTVAILNIATGGGATVDQWKAAVPFTWGNTDTLSVDFTVPIAEWAGSGTVNVVQNDVEYASNSSTNDATDSTTFAYGPSGAQFVSFTTATRTKRVRFLSPIQQTDVLMLEILRNGSWIPLSSATTVTQPWTVQNTLSYGIGYAPVSGTATDVDVDFATARLVAGSVGYGAAGTDWSGIAASASFKWRLKKFSGGNAVGFGIASAGSTGLVSYYQEDDTTLAAVTFAGNNGGSASASIAVRITRVGTLVTLDIPQLITVVPTTASSGLTSSTALPTWARPISQKSFVTCSYNNGAFVNTTVGALNVETTGILNFYRDIVTTAYTNSANAGWNRVSVTYSVR